MLVNKYNWWRKLLYKLYGVFPPARIIKQSTIPLKVRKLRRVLAERTQVLAEAEARDGKHPLFSHVEIETINRCNGECGFCPVNRHIDPRKPARMTEALFHSIIDQLAELDYNGTLYPYSNNEPLLDTRINDFVGYARERLPKATICIYSNGILLTPERYMRIIDHVDDFTINNYCEDFRLAPHLRELYEMVEANPRLAAKTRFVMRYRKEIMTSRAGQSPNKYDIMAKTLPVGCLLPTRQLVIRPDGKISLCCNDALGKITLGDASEARLTDIWWGQAYSELRRKVLGSRDTLDLCRLCDTMHA